MQLFDRLGYSMISAIFGAVIGVAGWWLYGLAHSLNYAAPAIDPVLRHWLVRCIAVFAVLGFVFKDTAADFVADTMTAIVHFEFNEAPDNAARYGVGLVFLAICIAAIWFTTPA